ncbi:MAG TPA: Ig-like domain-containing protein [Candidatus Saccharimonadales bacterium]|nr:Ig-like domain-containing protein [Candidatus Saccharimonadales bacterium]
MARKSSKKKRVSVVSSFGRRKMLSRNGLLVFVCLFAVAGAYLLFRSNAQSPVALEHVEQAFVNKPERGLYWGGLRPGRAGGPCNHLLEIANKAGNVLGCTHGPDPSPENVDVRQSAQAVSAADTTTATTSGGSVTCLGDGVSGNRVQAVYVHASDQPDRYDEFASSFQQYAATADNVFYESAMQTGYVRHLRYVTDANCNVVVDRVTVAPEAIAKTPENDSGSFYNTIDALTALGYNRPDRHYLLWVDTNVYCGMGTIRGDDRPSSDNANNGGQAAYSRVDSGCWGNLTAAHEIMHNLGGVQLSAPHSTGGWHCKDEYDRMCYDDYSISAADLIYPCYPLDENGVPSQAEDNHFDCNKDDYFNPKPLADNYLATHWNTANSSFLFDPNAPVVISPTVTISSPAADAQIKQGARVKITATAKDDGKIAKMEIYVYGNLKATSSSSSISYTWSTRKTIGGQNITVKAYDTDGNIGQSSIMAWVNP